jgi:hypothetical protein
MRNATGKPRPLSFTDGDLRAAAQSSRSMIQLAQTLGLPPSSWTNATLRERARQLGIVLPHGWDGPRSWIPSARLTAVQVLNIRASPRSDAALAAHYGVTKKTVWAARTRRTWRHLP